jgi:hypothetical protein
VPVVALKYPQGFELLVSEPEQDVPERLQFTLVVVVFLKLAVNVIDSLMGA